MFYFYYGNAIDFNSDVLLIDSKSVQLSLCTEYLRKHKQWSRYFAIVNVLTSKQLASNYLIGNN